MPSRPPFLLPNYDSRPHYCLKITVYETTCKGRLPLPVRLWMARNVKHIMRGDLDIATVQILDHISSVGLWDQGLEGQACRGKKLELPITWIGRAHH